MYRVKIPQHCPIQDWFLIQYFHIFPNNSSIFHHFPLSFHVALAPVPSCAPGRHRAVARCDGRPREAAPGPDDTGMTQDDPPIRRQVTLWLCQQFAIEAMTQSKVREFFPIDSMMSFQFAM
jgi:hypothetical protein